MAIKEKGLPEKRQTFYFTGAPDWTRTSDTGIRNPLLYPLLSYGGGEITGIRSDCFQTSRSRSCQPFLYFKYRSLSNLALTFSQWQVIRASKL
jgi:hypothetical protein